MRRILLMAGAAFLIVLAACSDVQRGAQAHADDGAERVRLLSAAETLDAAGCATPVHNARSKRGAEPARACADTELEG
ncbi:MAG: hypothetical protein ACLFQ5_01095 [Oceanicaulis sp.]